MVAKRKYQHTFRVPADESQPLKFWRGIVELKAAPDGTRRRRYVNSKDRDKAERITAQLKADAKATQGELSTRPVTVADWFTEWFEGRHTLEIKPKTIHTYRGLIRREILPMIGSVKLDRLTTADVRRLLTAVVTISGADGTGLSSTTAAQVHRILVIALNAAEADGQVARNVARLVKAPRKAATDLIALTSAQAHQVLQTAAGDERWSSLWWAVLLTGARQGELLGLEIDRIGAELDVSWQLQRLTWEHGCDPFCGRKRGADCRQRKVTAPADWRARHLTGGLWLTTPKTAAGRRMVGVSLALAKAMHREMLLTAEEPNPFGLMWRMPDGNPIDPRVQSEAWHDLLKRAGVPDVRLHDGRHTTVDVGYQAGIAEGQMPGVFGHSMVTTTRGYRSAVSAQERKEVMERITAEIMRHGSDTPLAIAE